LQRTRLLLHLVDLAPLDETQDPAESVRQLQRELSRFDENLAGKPRWLVFTKADLLDREEAESRVQNILVQLAWEGEWALISSVTRDGTRQLMERVSRVLERFDEDEQEAMPEGSDRSSP
jgi:GTP-binding protein